MEEDREIVTTIIEYIGWEDAVEIKKIREDLDRLEILGATHINLWVEYNYVYSHAEVQRLETNEEYNKRLEDIKKLKELKKIGI